MYKIFFTQTNLKYYSPCPNLEGIKDALCKCSGLVRMVEPCAQTWWSKQVLSASRERGSQASCKARGSATVISVSRVHDPVVSKFEQSVNVYHPSL